MNLFAAALSIAALISSVAATITFQQPISGTFWYTKTPNFVQLISNNDQEKFATIRFSSCRECFSLTVATNTTVPIVLPRTIRRNNMLNLYAISNMRNTAYAMVNVIDTLCVTAGASCYDKLPCDRRRGCGYYAENSADSQQEANQAELVYIAYESAEAKALQAAQDQAAADLAADILAIESEQQVPTLPASSA